MRGCANSEPEGPGVGRAGDGATPVVDPECLSLRPMVEQLYRSESHRLVKLVARRTLDREEARDIVQELFSRLLRGGLVSGPLQRPQAYLSRMAVNLVRDRAKAAVRRSSSKHQVPDENELRGPDQVAALESRDMLNRIEAAMLRLRPRTREIFLAHRIDGLSYAEIADRMGITVKGVEKQMSKAIAQLDRLLDRR
jgi:RNA polymerase sigma factor (sigma-70 family)